MARHDRQGTALGGIDGFRRAAGLLAVSALVSGCANDAFTYTLERYGRVPPINVTLNCRDTYEIFDRPDAGTMIVVTNPFNEIAVGCLDGGVPDLATRQRQVARIVFDEKTYRPACRITGETVLTARHREFAYVCPAPPEPAAAAARKPARRA